MTLEHRENVFHRLEVIASIAQNVDDADDTPVLQFVEAVADVGAGDAKVVAAIFSAGSERGKGTEEHGFGRRCD